MIFTTPNHKCPLLLLQPQSSIHVANCGWLAVSGSIDRHSRLMGGVRGTRNVISMAFSEVISRCSDKWRAEGIKLAPPITESEVRRVWCELQSQVSADVLALYTTIGGFRDYTCDDELFWSFWPWDWLQQRNQEDPKSGVTFCDHSIEVITWELRYENEQTSAVWSSHGNRTAVSLESFLESYLKDPWKLL